MHAVRFVVSRGAVALVILLNACGGGGVTGTGGIPPAGVRQTIESIAPTAPLTRLGISPEARKGPGVYGVSFDDLADINDVQKHDCGGPPSYCSEFVKQKEVGDKISVSYSKSGHTSSAKVAATVALGSLTGSSTIKRHVVGGNVQIGIKWEDTITITSKKLPANTPVSLKATLQIAGKPAPCMGNGSGFYWANDLFSITTTYSGLEYVSQCGSPQEILKATVKTYVGARFTESGIFDASLGVDPYGSTCPSCPLNLDFTSGTLTATYHLDPITHGASYITASGKSYL